MTHDTLPDAEAIRAAAMLRLTPVERLKIALELSDTIRRVAEAARARQETERIAPTVSDDGPTGDE